MEAMGRSEKIGNDTIGDKMKTKRDYQKQWYLGEVPISEIPKDILYKYYMMIGYSMPGFDFWIACGDELKRLRNTSNS